MLHVRVASRLFLVKIVGRKCSVALIVGPYDHMGLEHNRGKNVQVLSIAHAKMYEELCGSSWEWI